MRDIEGKEPTAKQMKILNFVRSSLQNGTHPTMRSIQEHVGCKSLNTIVGQLGLLERKGLLKRNLDGKLMVRS